MRKKASIETTELRINALKAQIGVLQEAEEWSAFSDTEQVMIEYMSRLVDAYLDTVRKNLLDSVPKVGTGKR